MSDVIKIVTIVYQECWQLYVACILRQKFDRYKCFKCMLFVFASSVEAKVCRIERDWRAKQGFCDGQHTGKKNVV